MNAQFEKAECMLDGEDKMSGREGKDALLSLDEAILLLDLMMNRQDSRSLGRSKRIGNNTEK